MRISVIIPTYKRARTIKACLKSVCDQSLTPFELIIVDDCSQDDTVDIVHSMKDHRIRCFSLDRQSGAQAARNRGIVEAKGEWIAFQDSDDIWLPEKLKKQIAVLKEVNFHPYTVIHGNAYKSHSGKAKRVLWKLPLVEGSSDLVYPQLLSEPSPCFPALLTSKAALEKIGLLDTQVPAYQEWDTSIRLARYCQFIHIKDPLFIYNLEDEGTISGNIEREYLGWKYVCEKHESEIRTLCGDEVWLKHLSILLAKCLTYGLFDEFMDLTKRHNLDAHFIERAYTHYFVHCVINRKWTDAGQYFSKINMRDYIKDSLLRLLHREGQSINPVPRRNIHG